MLLITIKIQKFVISKFCVCQRITFFEDHEGKVEELLIVDRVAPQGNWEDNDPSKTSLAHNKLQR